MIMAYSPEQITAQLQSVGRMWKFYYRVLDDFNVFQFNANVSSCTITNDELADVKRRATFVINGEDAEKINFARWRIQPVAQLRMPDYGWAEWPLGVFMLSSPTQTHLSITAKDRNVSAFDLGKILDDDLLIDRYVLPEGSRYDAAVKSILTSCGLPNDHIATSTRVTTKDREWPPGTKKGTLIDDILSMMNYASLYFDVQGNPVGVPYQLPSDAPILYTYGVDDKGVILPDPGVEETLDMGSVPNVFVAYVSIPDSKGGDPTVLRSAYVNNLPNSPTSTVSVGRLITSYQEVQDIADQEALDAKVAKIASDASQIFSEVTFSTGFMPIHNSADVIMLDWGDGGLRYRETQWQVELRAGVPMQHTARRVVHV